MHRTRLIVRIILILLTVFVIVFLNGKTEGDTKSIVEFKVKMYEKLKTDSLDSKAKVDLLFNETTKFVDDSSRLKRGLNYLTAILTLMIIAELVFVILGNNRSRS
jgi:hypothetical protein